MSTVQNGLSNKIKYYLILTLVGLLIIFALQNSEEVTVVFLLWEMSLPRIIMLFIFFFTGIILGLFLGNLKIPK